MEIERPGDFHELDEYLMGWIRPREALANEASKIRPFSEAKIMVELANCPHHTGC